MKHKLIKIWGIGLTFVLVVGMLFGAAPASAGELDWSTFSPFPSTTGYVLANSTDVKDIAVSEDGVMYALTGADNFVYKSTNGGRSWTQLSKNFGANPEYVSVALDDSDMVAVSLTTDAVWISTNGGSTWGDLNAGTAGIATIRDLSVSATDSGHNFVGVAADDTIWYFEVGAAAPSWQDTTGDPGWVAMTNALAVNFSPNIASDKVMVAVTGNTSGTWLQVYSLNTEAWNTPFGSGYPVRIQNDTTDITDTTMARIAMSPDYLGSDDSLRNLFVGISAGTQNNAGVYRIKDDTDKEIEVDENIYSIDYDGTNLVAGAADGGVLRSDNPMASDPDFSSTSTLKLPGRSSTTTPNTNVVLAFRGSDVVAGTTGDSSAFAISMDNGASFNDISMIDTVGTNLGSLMDMSNAPDGSIIYLLADDANATSMFRYMNGLWERVLAIESGSTFIIRAAPDDPESVYMAEVGDRDIYYSQEAGDTKWFQRTARYDVGDMAVESADILYIAIDGASTVSKSSNSGFTWGSSKETEVTGGSIHMIMSLGEDEVIVGSNQGYVAWSADGGDSWDKVSKQLNSGQLTQATASGLSTGDYIYAASSTTGTRVERWEIGQSSTSWDNLEAPTNSTMGAYGIALSEGALYVQTANASNSQTLRTLSPTDSEPSSGMWSVMAETASFDVAPRALWFSTGSTTLWSVDTATPALYSYLDALTAAGPTLVGPADGFEVRFNTVSGYPFDVALTWERPSKATLYDVQVALDSSFNEKVLTPTVGSTTASTPSYVIDGNSLDPETTYYWRVRVNINGPVRSAWSETRMITVGEMPEPGGTITIPPQPTPTLTVPQPTITVPAPTISIPPQPAPTTITIPPAPTPAPAVPSWALYVIIVIGAVLVIALIVLIMRTRRPM
jgi:photosystem II stability/assembly factor-like uncharacterized protein